MDKEKMIVLWLEASGIANDGVTTTDACKAFGMSRQNMAAYVGKWKRYNTHAQYDANLKKFIVGSSRTFDNKSAAGFLRAFNRFVGKIESSYVVSE